MDAISVCFLRRGCEALSCSNCALQFGRRGPTSRDRLRLFEFSNTDGAEIATSARVCRIAKLVTSRFTTAKLRQRHRPQIFSAGQWQSFRSPVLVFDTDKSYPVWCSDSARVSRIAGR